MIVPRVLLHAGSNDEPLESPISTVSAPWRPSGYPFWFGLYKRPPVILGSFSRPVIDHKSSAINFEWMGKYCFYLARSFKLVLQ